MGVDAGEQSLPIEVTMLGYFAVRRGDRAVTEDDGRTKKVWILMEYLLANRHSDISQDKLIEVLWEDVEKCDDPYHALKKPGVPGAQNAQQPIGRQNGVY